MKEQIEEMTPLDLLANDINQHCPDLAENYCGDTHCVACMANALYNAGYRKQSEWISVTERMPEQEGTYLVCSCEYNQMMTRCSFYHDGVWWFGNFDNYTVTHWMPLPEPPEMKGGAE